MTDQELTQKIHTEWGETIAKVCNLNSDQAAMNEHPEWTLQPEFLAALIANESGGESNARRFEKNVLADLWEVLLGRKEAYGSISRGEIVNYVTSPTPIGYDRLASALQRADSLATSWGLTQIMGWHTLEAWWKDTPGWYQGIEDLKTPLSNLTIARAMLSQFADKFQLDLRKDFTDLFICWNTGNPAGRTFDPMYVAKGLNRMEAYHKLL